MLFSILAAGMVAGQVALLEPADNASTYMIHPQFKWSADADADRYEIQIATVNDFSELVDRDSVPVPRYVPLAILNVNRDYWWRVRPQYADGTQGVWSQERKLRVNGPGTIYRVSPSDTQQEVLNAIAAAAANTPCRLIFDDGSYDLDLPDQTYLFGLNGVEDLYIDGGTADFVFRNPNSGFLNMKDCTNVTVRRFNIDYYRGDDEKIPITHTTGSIVSMDAASGSFVFKPWDDYLPPTDSAISNAHFRYWGALMDTNFPGALKSNVNNFYELTTEVTDLGTNQYRLYLDPVHWDRLADFEEGDVMVKNASYRMHLLRAVRCKNVTFELIRNVAASGNHFIGRWNDAISFLRCSSELDHGWLTSNPCGGYVGGGDATGFWIEECLTEGMMDDAVNCANYPVDVHSQISSNQFYAYAGDPAGFLTNGSAMIHYNPPDAESYGTYVVDGLEPVTLGGESLIRVTVDRDLGTVYPGRDTTNTQFFVEARMHPNAYIRNSTFRNSRRIGCILRSHGGVVEGNTFSHLSDSAILGENQCSAFAAGFDNSNVRILSNTMVRCGTSSAVQAQGRGVIQFSITGAGVRCRQRLHENIEIAHNTILDWPRRALYLENVKGAQVHSNIISNPSAAGFWIPEETYAMYLKETEGITIADNQITDTRPMTAAVYLHLCDDPAVLYNELPGTVFYDDEFKDPAALTGTVNNVQLDSTTNRLVAASASPLSNYQVLLGVSPVTADPAVTAIRWSAALTVPTNDWVGIGFQESAGDGMLASGANTGPWVMFRPTYLSIQGGHGTGDATNTYTYIELTEKYEAGELINVVFTFYPLIGAVDLYVEGMMVANRLEIKHLDERGGEAAPVIGAAQIHLRNQAPGGTSVDFFRVETVSIERR